MTKFGREIMEIFEAFDLTGTAWSAAQLTGCDAKTVARYVAVRDAGGDPLAKTCRPRLIDVFMPKVEELVDRSKGKIRADVAHRKITAMGYRGSERSTRRAGGGHAYSFKMDRAERLLNRDPLHSIVAHRLRARMGRGSGRIGLQRIVPSSSRQFIFFHLFSDESAS